MFTKLKINWQVIFIVNLFFLMININSVGSQTDVQAEKDKKLLIQGLLEDKVPKASTRGVLKEKEVFSKCPNNCYSISDTSVMLSKALRDAGYSQQGWYLAKRQRNRNEQNISTSSTKIAVVTELEQISDDGKPKQGRERWKDHISPPPVSSWSDFMSTLLKGSPAGRYRAFLFAFSDDMSNTYRHWRQDEKKLEGLRNSIRNGARLPIDESLKTISTKGLYWHVFVYEYTVSPVDGSVELVENSSLTAKEHLKASGIWKALGGK